MDGEKGRVEKYREETKAANRSFCVEWLAALLLFDSVRRKRRG